MPNFLSPSIEVQENSSSLNVTNTTGATFASVGLYRWGPVNTPVSISTNESELAQKFGTPSSVTSVYFHSAANYLNYSSSLVVVRADDPKTGKNATIDSSSVYVGNDTQYATVQSTLTSSFIGKYPGSYVNGITISLANEDNYGNWKYSSAFDYAPQNDEFNMVVIDTYGTITGTPNAILERYSLLSTKSGSKKPDGTSAYLPKVLQNQSSYILAGNLNAINTNLDGTTSNSSDSGSSSSSSNNTTNSGIYEETLTGGKDGFSGNPDFSSAIASLGASEKVNIIGSFGGGLSSKDAQTLASTMENREDAVAYLAPDLDSVTSNDPTTAILNYFSNLAVASTYVFLVDNWKMVYDKYNDTNIWIPCDSDVAGLVSSVFTTSYAWMSPAGLNRGVLKNVIKLAWNATKPDRDQLYPKSINSIIQVANAGFVLFGDKTATQRPSPLSRINVRDLLIVIKKNIANSLNYLLFEWNDDITRSIASSTINQYMATIASQQGVNRYLVKCDTENNTPQIIANDELVIDIWIQPINSINWIVLNLNVVDATVSFSEIENGNVTTSSTS